MLRHLVGPQVAAALVLFGDVINGEEAARLGIAYRCVPDDELLDATHALAARAASVPRELLTVTKATIGAMARVDEHADAVAVELEPQLWSTRQPWFAERVAALQAKITSR